MGPSSDEPGHLSVDGGNPATCLEELCGWCESRGIHSAMWRGWGRAVGRRERHRGPRRKAKLAGSRRRPRRGSGPAQGFVARGPGDPRGRGLGLSRRRAPRHRSPCVSPAAVSHSLRLPGLLVPVRALLDHPGRSPPASFLPLVGWEALWGVGRAGLAWLLRAKSGA